MLHPICTQLTASFLNQYHSSAWFSDYIKIATKELVKYLSECLSPSLFDLFSESIPFGLRIQRFYQNPANPSSSPRIHFNLFLEKSLSNCFADLIKTFPVSIYLIGHTIYTWHHRHIELLDRLQLHCQHIFNSLSPNLLPLVFQRIQVATIIISTEEVMSSLYHFNLIVSIAYAINQSLSTTTSSFDVCEQFFSKYIDHQLVLPRVHNFGSYGFLVYFKFYFFETDTHDSLRRDGIWLFNMVIWIYRLHI